MEFESSPEPPFTGCGCSGLSTVCIVGCWGCVLPVGVGGEALQDVGDVWGLDGFGDVVGGGDLFAGVSQLCGGALGVGFLLDQGGHGLAVRVRSDPGEVGVGAGLTPLAADVVGREPGAGTLSIRAQLRIDLPGGRGQMRVEMGGGWSWSR